MPRLAAIIAGALALAACAPAPAPEPEPRPRPGKLELFGDATRLPTRAGERARRELALAGELDAAVTGLGLDCVHVDVRVAQAGEAAAAAIVVAGPAAEAAAEIPSSTIQALAAAIVPKLEPSAVEVVWRAPALATAAEADQASKTPIWALVLAALGLGLSLGVTVERARTLRPSTAPER